MITGMTGYGHADFSSGEVKGVIEVKSLNHRYFDLSYYLPVGFGSVENKVRKAIQKKIRRGRVTVSLKITQKPSSVVSLNRNIVKNHIKFSNKLKREFGLQNDLTLSDIVKLPGVFETKDSFVNPDKIWNAIDKALKKALNGLVIMRSREGKSLHVEFNSILRRMLLRERKIRARSKSLLSEHRKKLTIDEFSSYQKSSDIREETTRLVHYIEEIKLLLKSSATVGKKVDFIAQEMQRETNTIGAKVQDKIVSNAVIALKGKIEKIREQSQNIE